MEIGCHVKCYGDKRFFTAKQKFCPKTIGNKSSNNNRSWEFNKTIIIPPVLVTIPGDYDQIGGTCFIGLFIASNPMCAGGIISVG